MNVRIGSEDVELAESRHDSGVWRGKTACGFGVEAVQTGESWTAMIGARNRYGSPSIGWWTTPQGAVTSAASALVDELMAAEVGIRMEMRALDWRLACVDEDIELARKLVTP